jgi:hypothetical protein
MSSEFERSERDRQTRLLRVLSLTIGGLLISGIGIFPLLMWLGADGVVLTGFPLCVVSAGLCFLSYRLAGYGGYYDEASRLLVGSFSLVVAFDMWIFGLNGPLLTVILLPLGLVGILRPLKETAKRKHSSRGCFYSGKPGFGKLV